ncbi:unnamed protein product, partial [Ixodes persulcatus]
SGKYYRESFANHCQFKFEVSFISLSPKVLITFLAVGSLSLSLSVSLNLFVSVDFVQRMQSKINGGTCSLHSNFLFAPALYLHCSAMFGRRFRGSVFSECPATLMQSMRLLHV